VVVDDIFRYNNYFRFILYNTKMTSSVQKVVGLVKTTEDLERDEFSDVYTSFQRTYNDIKAEEERRQQSGASRFNPEVIPETIDMLIHDGIITYDNSVSLERFLQTFYIVNDEDTKKFSFDKMTIQKCFNRLSTTNFIRPTIYIQLINVDCNDNLSAFIDLYNNFVFGKTGNSGGKRRKSISRTRGPSKRKRRSISAKSTSIKYRRRTKHRRH